MLAQVEHCGCQGKAFILGAIPLETNTLYGHVGASQEEGASPLPNTANTDTHSVLILHLLPDASMVV